MVGGQIRWHSLMFANVLIRMVVIIQFDSEIAIKPILIYVYNAC